MVQMDVSLTQMDIPTSLIPRSTSLHTAFWLRETRVYPQLQLVSVYVSCAWSLQSCLTLCSPMDCSLPASLVQSMGFSRQVPAPFQGISLVKASHPLSDWLILRDLLEILRKVFLPLHFYERVSRTLFLWIL